MNAGRRREATLALEQCGGRIRPAALLLGYRDDNWREFYHAVKNDRVLAPIWCGRRNGKDTQRAIVMTEANRRNLPEPAGPSPDDLALAKAIADDEAFGQSIATITAAGVSAADLSKALAQHHRKFYAHGMAMFGGGEDRLYLGILRDLEEINSELKAVAAELKVASDEQRELLQDRERTLRQDRAELLRSSQQIFANAQKAVMVQHLVNGKRKAQGQPRGFLSLPVQAQAGSRVQVNLSTEAPDMNDDSESE